MRSLQPYRRGFITSSWVTANKNKQMKGREWYSFNGARAFIVPLILLHLDMTSIFTVVCRELKN